MTPFIKFICTECGHSDRPCKHFENKEEQQDAKFLRSMLLEIIHLLNAIHAKLFYPSGMEIFEITQESEMSTPAGGTSVFQEVPTPAGTLFPTGTTFQWTVDDTADITLTPSSDGTQVTATCVATPTGTSYNLTCTSSYTPPGAPTPISATINVPITQPAPPTPTGMQINQLS